MFQTEIIIVYRNLLFCGSIVRGLSMFYVCLYRLFPWLNPVQVNLLMKNDWKKDWSTNLSFSFNKRPIDGEPCL